MCLKTALTQYSCLQCLEIELGKFSELDEKDILINDLIDDLISIVEDRTPPGPGAVRDNVTHPLNFSLCVFASKAPDKSATISRRSSLVQLTFVVRRC